MRFTVLNILAIIANMAFGHPGAIGREPQVPSNDPVDGLRELPSDSASFDYNLARANLANTDPELAKQSAQGGGLFGCYLYEWSGGCTWFPLHDGCQVVRVQNNQGGWENELRSLGPDQGTKCYVFAGTDCKTGAFYPKHTTPNKDWSLTYPGEGRCSDVTRSFYCVKA